MKNAIKKFEGLKVLVIGDVMIDAYLIGYVERISPEAPVPGSTECDTKLSDAGLLHK
jgi:bifunctional ADP-heptose synthase (sugar kinase/adenylyltransferase)